METSLRILHMTLCKLSIAALLIPVASLRHSEASRVGPPVIVVDHALLDLAHGRVREVLVEHNARIADVRAGPAVPGL